MQSGWPVAAPRRRQGSSSRRSAASQAKDLTNLSTLARFGSQHGLCKDRAGRPFAPTIGTIGTPYTPAPLMHGPRSLLHAILVILAASAWLLGAGSAAAASAASAPAAPLRRVLATPSTAAPPPAPPTSGGLEPCAFGAAGNDSWRLRQRDCTPIGRALHAEARPSGNAADPTRVAYAGAAPAPGEPGGAAGTTVWAAAGAADNITGSGSLVVFQDRGAPTRLELRDITCAGCLDLAAPSLQRLLLPQQLLRPLPGAAAAALPPSVLGASNVLVVGGGLEPAAVKALFDRVLAAQAVQDLLREWSLAVYTDGASYLVVPKAQIGALNVAASGALVAPEPLAPPPPGAPGAAPSGPNFVLGVTNATLHDILARLASIDTPDPLLLLITSNITLAPHPGLPHNGSLAVRRPVVLLGRDGITTSIDFGGKVNVLRVSGRGNITFDSLALDNLFPGDEESMRGVRGLSATVAYSLFGVLWGREDLRVMVVRCTLAVPDQAQIERLKFFISILNSVDPELVKQAEWMRTGPRSTVSLLSVDGRPGAAIVLFITKAVAYKDTYVQAANMVAPRLTLQPSDNVFAAAEKAALAVGSPLHVQPILTMLRGPQDLLAMMPLGRPTTIMVVPPEGADMSPLPDTGWPPSPEGLTITAGPVPNTLILFGDLPTNATPPAPAAPGAPPEPPPRPPPPRPGTPAHRPLWLGGATNLIQVPPGSKESIELRGLTLMELGQGPGAARATSLEVPDVWTHLVWAVNSTLDEPRLLLDDCQLMLPSPELRHLLALAAAAGGDFCVALEGGRRSMSFRGAAALGDGSLHVAAYEGAGMRATRLLLSEARWPRPPGYAWPTPPGTSQPGPRLPPWAAAMVAVIGAGAALLLGAVLLRRRRTVARRRRAAAAAAAGEGLATPGRDDKPPAGLWPFGGRKGGGSDESSGGAADDTRPARDAARVLAGAAQAAAGDVEAGLQGLGDADSGVGMAVLVGGPSVVPSPTPSGSTADGSGGDSLDGRWQALSRKIGKRISRIHMHKLASALNERVPAASEAGGGSGGGGSSDDEEEEEAAGPGPQSRLSEVSTGMDTPSLDLQLLSPIGQGSFGTVWRGVLQGHTDVAVKLMQLPDLSSLGPSGAQAAATIRERMVVQEAAIASAVAHPHVVSVFSVGLRPCRPPQQQPAPGAVEQAAPAAPLRQAGRMSAPSTADSSVRGGAVLWQLTIVMEYCDQGTLRQALDRGRLRSPRTGRTHLPTALALARDVAASLQYLHSQQVVHGDLKASNVLLKTAALPPRGGVPGLGARHVAEGGDGSGKEGSSGVESGEGAPSSGANLIQGGWVVAKICDFGLSSFLDTAGASTALSTQICGGTLTHMAPELLTSAKPTKASDVYAFGILLFEILTGERPYAGIHNALLGHAVVASRKRPAWPSAMGPEFREAKALAEECWQHHPHARPSFRDVVSHLGAIHQAALALAGGNGSGSSAGTASGASGLGAARAPPLVSPFAAAVAAISPVTTATPAAGDGGGGGGGSEPSFLPDSGSNGGGGSSGPAFEPGSSTVAPAAAACAVAAPTAGGRAGPGNRSSLVGWF
ncbi:MAG: hypothetical protein J3K34DRAFT_457740 [Monoraphidium minutum]|nr:MAG: hypothetical protein J3K34DRAFT_457740 [Monoraphidium minutum]